MLLSAAVAVPLLLLITRGGPSQQMEASAGEPIAVAGASPQTTDLATAVPVAGDPGAGDIGSGASWPGTSGLFILSGSEYGDDGLPAGQSSGVISGFVSSGELIPLAGITVHLADSAGVPTGRSVSTDVAGRFRLADLVPGSYRLFFSDPAGYYRSSWYGGGSGSPIAISSGQDAGIVFSMVRNNSPQGNIAGTVTGHGGWGLAGIEVLVYEVDSPVVLLEFRSSVFTAGDGSYMVSSLAPGNYKVLFQPSGGFYSLQWYRGAADNEAAELIPLHAGETVGKVDAALEEGGRVSGRIYNNGLPAAFALVDVFDSTGVIVDSTITDAQGYYVSEPLPAGFYKVRVAPGAGFAGGWYGGGSDFGAGSWVQIIAGEKTQDIDILLSAPPVATAFPSAGNGAPAAIAAVSPSPSGVPAELAASALPGHQPGEAAVSSQEENGTLAGDNEE